MDFNFLRECGHIIFPVMDDKTPCIPAWQKLTTSARISTHTKAVGITLQSHTLIVDVDPRNGGNASWEKLNTLTAIPDTYTVQTGGGGFHYYFQKPPNIKLYKKHKDYPGIEFLTNGCYAIAEQSVCYTGVYTRTNGTPDHFSWQPAPNELIHLLTKPLSPTYEVNVVEPLTESDALELFTRFLVHHAKPAIQGDGGDHQTFSVAAMGRDYGLNEQSTLDAMILHWNDTCEPPWDHAELEIKVHNAFSYSQNPPGCRTVNFTKIQSSNENTPALLKSWPVLDSKGHISSKPGDLQHLFTVNSPIFDKPNPIFGLFRTNTMTGIIEYAKPAPWHSIGDFPIEKEPIVDLLFRSWLSSALGVHVSRQIAWELIEMGAYSFKYNPIINWFESLEWDHVPRIHTLFTKYCNAENNAIATTFGEFTMRALVKRIMEPGCVYDFMVILEGAQGIRKSGFCELLALSSIKKLGNFYAPIKYMDHLKDMEESCMGMMVIEMAELAGMKKADVESMKSYITNRSPKFRKAYGREAEFHKRTCVFIGTTNTVNYLIDQTGNRRFIPIKCKGTIKTEELIADLPQLYAEAYWLYNNRPMEYFTVKPEVLAELEVRQTDAIDTGVTAGDDKIIEYLTAHADELISLDKLMEDCLGLTFDKFRSHSRDIASKMRRLGWEQTRRSSGIKWKATDKFKPKIIVEEIEL